MHSAEIYLLEDKNNSERSIMKDLFIVNPLKPMKFTIFEEKILKIKCNQVLKQIKEHGGIAVDYNSKDTETIILGSKACNPSQSLEIYNVKYVKDCISQEKVLHLDKYRVNRDKMETKSSSQNCNNCISIEQLLSKNKCEHIARRTAEEDLVIMKEILNVINYGILAWGGSYKSNRNLLQNLQTRILKIVNKNKIEVLGYPLNVEQVFTFESLRYHYSDLKNQYLTSSSITRKKKPYYTKK